MTRGLIRALVVTAEVLAVAVVLLLLIGDLVLFGVSYSAPVDAFDQGAYTGQADDRAAAVRILWMVVPGLLLVAGVVIGEVTVSGGAGRWTLPEPSGAAAGAWSGSGADQVSGRHSG